MTKTTIKPPPGVTSRLGQVLRGRVCPDPRYVETLRAGGDWMTARSVAAAHGHSVNVAAHALRRLAELGAIEEDVRDVTGTARSVEHMRVYRARAPAGGTRLIPTLLPGWLEPQGVATVGELRRIDGRAGMKRWK